MPAVRLITSGRDLLVLKNESATISDGDPIVIANPDFNYGGNHDNSYDKSNKEKWLALPGTQKEGRAIASLLKTHYVEEEDANKKFVKSLVSPKFSILLPMHFITQRLVIQQITEWFLPVPIYFY